MEGGTDMEEMTADIFYQIMNAREVLCAHCENYQKNKSNNLEVPRSSVPKSKDNVVYF